MDPLKINESEQDAWLQQYHAHQHQMERPSVLQPVHSMPPLPSPPATSETSDSQMTSQHPHLAAQLSASLANQNNQQSSSNSSGDGVPPFNSGPRISSQRNLKTFQSSFHSLVRFQLHSSSLQDHPSFNTLRIILNRFRTRCSLFQIVGFEGNGLENQEEFKLDGGLGIVRTGELSS